MSSGTGDGKLSTMTDHTTLGQPKTLGMTGLSTRAVTGDFENPHTVQTGSKGPRLVDISDGQILVLNAGPGTPSTQTNAVQRTIEEVLSAIGSTIPLIVVPATFELDSLNADMMARYGWVQVADVNTGEIVDVAKIADDNRQTLKDAGWIAPGDADMLGQVIAEHPDLVEEAGYISIADLLDDDSEWVNRSEVAMYAHEME